MRTLNTIKTIIILAALLASCGSTPTPKPQPRPPSLIPPGWMILATVALLAPIDDDKAIDDVNDPCLLTVASIVQHEAGNTKSATIQRFIAEQVAYDLDSGLPCERLTQSRWAIYRDGSNTTPTSRIVSLTATVLSGRHLYNRCQYTGNPGDLAHWRQPLRVDYTFTRPPFTVIGVNCADFK